MVLMMMEWKNVEKRLSQLSSSFHQYLCICCMCEMQMQLYFMKSNVCLLTCAVNWNLFHWNWKVERWTSIANRYKKVFILSMSLSVLSWWWLRCSWDWWNGLLCFYWFNWRFCDCDLINVNKNCSLCVWHILPTTIHHVHCTTTILLFNRLNIIINNDIDNFSYS